MRTLMFPSGWTLETAPSSGQKSLWFVSKNLQNCRRSHWTQWTQCLVLVSMSSKVQSPFKIKITFSQVPHTKLLSAFDPSRLAPVEHTHTHTHMHRVGPATPPAVSPPIYFDPRPPFSHTGCSFRWSTQTEQRRLSASSVCVIQALLAERGVPPLGRFTPLRLLFTLNEATSCVGGLNCGSDASLA